MSEIQGGRWDRFLSGLFNSKGTPGIAQALGSEVQPIVDVNPHPLCSDYLRGERLMGAKLTLAGGAGLRQYAELANPPGSNALIEHQLTTVRDATAATWFIWTIGSGTRGGTQGAVGIRDTRWEAAGIYTAPSSAQVWIQNIAAVFGAPVWYDYGGAAFSQGWYDQGVILKPGTSLYIWLDSLNHQGHYALNWRERPMESSEL